MLTTEQENEGAGTMNDEGIPTIISKSKTMSVNLRPCQANQGASGNLGEH